jgi:hypothetical protein
LQDLALLSRSLLAVTSDVTHIMATRQRSLAWSGQRPARPVQSHDRQARRRDPQGSVALANGERNARLFAVSSGSLGRRHFGRAVSSAPGHLNQEYKDYGDSDENRRAASL